MKCLWLGREVTTLVNQKADNYEVRLDGSSLPGSVYFYCLHAESFAAAKKFVLLK